MIEIQCPACGAAGRAPKDKIQTRLVCRKCLKIFHVTPTGKTVLGEPPVTGQSLIAGSHETTAIDSTQKVDQWFERTSKETVLALHLGAPGRFDSGRFDHGFLCHPASGESRRSCCPGSEGRSAGGFADRPGTGSHWNRK